MQCHPGYSTLLRYKAHGSLVPSVVLQPAEPDKVYVFMVGRYAKFSAVSHLGWE